MTTQNFALQILFVQATHKRIGSIFTEATLEMLYVQNEGWSPDPRQVPSFARSGLKKNMKIKVRYTLDFAHTTSPYTL